LTPVSLIKSLIVAACSGHGERWVHDPMDVVTNEGASMRSMILGLLLLMANVAHAEPLTYVIGLGHFSCGQFIATIGKNPPGRSQSIQTGDGEMVGENVGYLQWMMGFVSGFNAAHADDVQQQVVREFDVAGMDLWLRNWCNKHPTQKILHGASAFIDEMRSNTEKRK